MERHTLAYTTALQQSKGDWVLTVRRRNGKVVVVAELDLMTNGKFGCLGLSMDQVVEEGPGCLATSTMA